MKRIEVEQGTISHVRVETTGLKGGDSGHGGRHVFEIGLESGHLDVEVQALGALRPRKIEGLSLVRLTLGGDWELQALYGMLKVGLEELEKQIVALHGEEKLKAMERELRECVADYEEANSPERQRMEAREMKAEGLKVSEIAKILGVSVKQVREYCKD